MHTLCLHVVRIGRHLVGPAFINAGARNLTQPHPLASRDLAFRVGTRLRILAVLVAGLSTVAAAPAHAQNDPVAQTQSYLEAMGGSVEVAEVADRGADSNPLLNDAAAAGKQQPARDTHEGNIEHRSNVPAPAKAGQGTQAPGPQQRQSAPAGAQRTSVPQQSGAPQGNNSTSADSLPSPKIDLAEEAVKRLAPANAEQLRKILEELYTRQGAALTPARPGIVGRAVQYNVDLSPGATPPVVRVSRGLGATVNFVDAAGNPWPITFANNFYAEAFTVTQMAPHVLSVASNSPHLSGSVGVMLKGLTAPVNFIVTPGQDETDYRADLHIPGLSPDAAPVPGGLSPRPDVAGGNLMDFLYGATPKGATRLKVTGAGVEQSNTRAWQAANGQLVLRTSAHVVSPGWYNMQPALDGTTVYALPGSPVVRVSVNGEVQSFTVEGLLPMKAGRGGANGLKADRSQ